MLTRAERPCFTIVTALLLMGLAACNHPQNQAAAPADQGAPVANGDPAGGNLASADQMPPASPSGQSYAPPTGGSYNTQQDYDQLSSGQQPVQAPEPPPPLPDYSQPPAPGDNYIWTPGSWDYANSDYYWVPGAWIVAPFVGALWTPPWWGFNNGAYLWHAGYWAPHIGFYGGIDYGFGYTGRGYYGAYWNNGAVYYNRSVTNVNVSIVHNVYNYSVPNNRGNRVSYNGGRGGIDARPTPQELAVVRDPRTPPVSAQIQHAREASTNRAQFAKTSGGHPAALVVARPIATPYQAPAARPAARPVPENRNTAQRAPVPQQPEARPEARPQVPEAHPQEPRPAAVPRSTPEVRPQPRPQENAKPAPRPAPEARPQEAARPASPVHSAPKPQPAPKPKEEERKQR
jgi:hypothetical protein